MGTEDEALAEALTETEQDTLEDLAESWGAQFPEARFSQRRGVPLLTITPAEAVELARRAYVLGAISQRPETGP